MKKNILSGFILLFSCFAASAQISLTTFSTGFTEPVDFKNAGDNRMFVVERAGRIKIVDSVGVHRPGIFLDIHTIVESSYGEEGLLGVAFPPDYQASGYFYCYYTRKNTWAVTISRFSVSATNPDSAVASSEQVLISIYHHFAQNHDGGGIAFGPDGYLYFGTGDGGSGNDPGNRSQNKDTLLGKMMRIDVSGGGAYAIPPTNPFVGSAGRDEIWAYGLRNPWRWSFDKWTGDLWIGDVGQNVWEEVDYQPASSRGGENYGWRCYEGNVHTSGITPQCSPPNAVSPVLVKNHSTGMVAIIGGYVYRGAKYSNLFGKYFYSDENTSSIGLRSITHVGNNFYDSAAVAHGGTFVSMGQDKWGELYVVDIGGTIYRLNGQTCSPTAFISAQDTMVICGDTSAILRTPAGQGFTYSWTWSGGIITSDSSTAQITQSMSGSYYVTVSDTNACINTSSTVYVYFAPKPAVSFSGLDTVYCSPGAADTLLGNPLGGIFAGHGISGNVFTPQSAGVGTHTIYYTVTSVDGCENTEAQSARVDNCVAVENISSFTDLNVFPNPGNGNFTIAFYLLKNAMMDVEVVSVLGQSVYHEAMNMNSGSQQVKLAIPGVSKGMYSLRINDGTGSVVKALVVN